jgi:hypothetical protein
MTNIKIDVRRDGIESGYVEASFDKAKAELEEEKFSIITPEQFAQHRIAEGANHSVSLNGAYTSMGSLMVPKRGRFLVVQSLVMQNPSKATEAHRTGNEFYVSDNDAEKSLASGSVAIPYAQSAVPFERFADDPITAFVFGKTAGEYGAFLKESLREVEVAEMSLWFNDQEYIDSQKKPFANHLWLRRLDGVGRSELRGGNGGLNYYYGVRGVRESAEGTHENFEAYTSVQLKRIEDALKELGFSGATKGLLEKLRNK